MCAHTDLIAKEAGGATKIWATEVIGMADVVAEFFDANCWRQDGPAIAAGWRLASTFPVGIPITSCSRCLREFDRQDPYTLLALQDEFYVGGALETIAAWDYAVLCSSCFPTAISVQSEVEIEHEQVHIGASNDWTGPADFPRTGTGCSIAGIPLKLAFVEYEVKYYELGCTPQELLETWDMCGDLAHQFARKCLETKAGKRSTMTKADIISQYYYHTLHLGWGTEEEIAWIFCRVAILLECPAPSAIVDVNSNR